MSNTELETKMETLELNQENVFTYLAIYSDSDSDSDSEKDTDVEIDKDEPTLVYGYNVETDDWHCTQCGVSMGRNNPRQLCCKSYCPFSDRKSTRLNSSHRR